VIGAPAVSILTETQVTNNFPACTLTTQLSIFDYSTQTLYERVTNNSLPPFVTALGPISGSFDIYLDANDAISNAYRPTTGVEAGIRYSLPDTTMSPTFIDIIFIITIVDDGHECQDD